MGDLIKEIYDQELMKLIRSTNIKVLSEELINVQPIDSNTISDLLKVSKSKEWLQENNYESVSSLELLYVKKEIKNEY